MGIFEVLTWRLNEGGSETGVVDERVGHQEEIRDNQCNFI